MNINGNIYPVGKVVHAYAPSLIMCTIGGEDGVNELQMRFRSFEPSFGENSN